MHPIFASLQAVNPQTLTEFLTVLSHQLVAFAQQAIDTPAERAAVENAVLTYFDQYFASHIPAPMVKPFRDSLLGMLDATLTTIASIP